MSVFELQTDNLIAAFDAGFQEEDLPVGTNPDGFDANGPNRFTIWVPTEHVIVNMGNPVRSGTVGLLNTYENVTDTVQVDGGFVAQTDHHIHFHTFGVPTDISYTAPNSEAEDDADIDAEAAKHKVVALGRTVVRLGTASTVVRAVEAYGVEEMNQIKSPTKIGSSYSQPYNSWAGYAMIAEGCAYHESQANHFVVSGTGDVRIAGLRSVLVGSPGDVHIAADGSSIADVVGNDGDNMNGPGQWVGYQRVEQGIDRAFAAIGLFLGFATTMDQTFRVKYQRSPTEGSIGWKGAQFSDVFGSLVSAATTGIGVYNFAKSVLPATPGGNVAIYAASGFTGYGTNTATIHAGISASLTSSLVAQVSASLATSISAMVAASVSSTTTSVGGLLSVSMSSQYGSATVRAKESVEISSSGKVFVAGKQDVQLNSVDGKVYLHGFGGFYLGAGAGIAIPAGAGGFGATTYKPGDGYGILGSNSELKLGAMKDAGTFTAPNPDSQIQMVIRQDGISVTHYGASLTLSHNQVKVGSGKETKILIG